MQVLSPLLTPPIPARTPTQPQTTAPAPAQLPTSGPDKTYAKQVTIQQLLHSPKEAYLSIREEPGLLIIRHFLAELQDGTTILLKTGGHVTIIIP